MIVSIRPSYLWFLEANNDSAALLGDCSNLLRLGIKLYSTVLPNFIFSWVQACCPQEKGASI